jgi:hypothetical protein
MKETKYLFFLLFLLISLVVNSQVKFVNRATEQPISNVSLLSNVGKIIGVSDTYGKINIADINSEFVIVDSDTIEAVQPDFISQKLTWNDLKKTNIIYLSPLKNIEEVVVTGKKQEFLMLRGYFFSYQSVDDIPEAFSDGMVEYYISLTKNKIVGFNIKENRTFERKDSTQKKKIIQFEITPNISPLSFSQEWILKSRNNSKNNYVSGDYIVQKSDTVGKVINNGDDTAFYIEFCTPEKPKEFSLFGLHVRTVNDVLSENFSSVPSFTTLKTLSSYEKSYITLKKSTKKYVVIKNFYVLDKKFLSKENFKDLNAKSNHSNTESNYSSNFWEDPGLPDIPSFIVERLNKELVLIKK